LAPTNGAARSAMAADMQASAADPTVADPPSGSMTAPGEDDVEFEALFGSAGDTAEASQTAPEPATAAATALDPSSTLHTAAAGNAGATAATAPDQPSAAGFDDDEDLLPELEAALFSGSEDEGDGAAAPAGSSGGADASGAAVAPSLAQAIQRLAPAGMEEALAAAAAEDAARAAAAEQAAGASAGAASSSAAPAAADGVPPAADCAAAADAATAGVAPADDGPIKPPNPFAAGAGGGDGDGGGPPGGEAAEPVSEFDETRYMKDSNGELLHKWKIDYAARAGGGRAMCKDTDCLERHDQGGLKVIEKGCLRIGRRVLMKGRSDDDEGFVQIMWYHARCIFNVFMRSRKNTRVIQSPLDLEGFEHINPEDQEMIRRFIVSNEDVRNCRLRNEGSATGSAAAAAGGGKRARPDTPEKPGGVPGGGGGPSGPGLLGESLAAKRRRTGQLNVTLRKGDRVWTFCRVRPPVVDGRPPAEFAVKSPKPELGMVVEEEKDGNVIIQFEKAEDEKERLALYATPKKAKIRGWLRYPRIFDGKKQRIPVSWVQFNRPPPRMCGCVQQSWNHQCEASGISCSRGASRKVWGVGGE